MSNPIETMSKLTLAPGETPHCVSCGLPLAIVEGEADLPEGRVEWLRCESDERLHRVDRQGQHPGQGSLL